MIDQLRRFICWINAEPVEKLSVETQVKLASRSTTSKRSLAKLATSPHIAVRSTVAKNSKTPSSTLAKMVEDSTPEEVLLGLAQNPSTPAKTLTFLYSHWYLHRALAGNKTTPVEILALLFDEPAIHDNLAWNPSLPEPFVSHLAKFGSHEAQQGVLTNPLLSENEQLRICVEAQFREWPAHYNGNVCTSVRVQKWRTERVSAEINRGIEENVVFSRWGGVRMEIEFPNPSEVTLGVFRNGIETPPSAIYGWWEQSMGAAWMVLTKKWNMWVGGLVPCDYDQMAQTAFFEFEEELDKTLLIHGPWSVQEVGAELVAHCWARKVMPLTDFPTLPNLQPAYSNPRPLATPCGKIRFNQKEYELILDSEGEPAAWQTPDGSQVPSLDPKQWEEFEQGLRILSFGLNP